MAEPRYRCPACGDRHTLEERVAADGKRLCPVCGEATAFIEDEGVDVPR